jgi:hypothetical protein
VDPLDAALADPFGEASVAGLAGADAAGAGGADGVGGVGTTDDGMAAEDGEAVDTSRDAAGVERDPERFPLGLDDPDADGGGGGGADDVGVALDGDAEDAEPLVVALRAAEAPRAEGSLPRGVTAGSAAPRPRRAACTLVAWARNAAATSYADDGLPLDVSLLAPSVDADPWGSFGRPSSASRVVGRPVPPLLVTSHHLPSRIRGPRGARPPRRSRRCVRWRRRHRRHRAQRT